MRAFVLLVALVACGGAQGAGTDQCATAKKEGAPVGVFDCPPGSSSEKTIERLGTRTVPTASGKATPLGAIATTLWCRRDDGEAVGPYRGLDPRGRVVRSGQYEAGLPLGAWVAWGARGNVLAITSYGADGSLIDEQVCSQ